MVSKLDVKNGVYNRMVSKLDVKNGIYNRMVFTLDISECVYESILSKLDGWGLWKYSIQIRCTGGVIYEIIVFKLDVLCVGPMKV